ncbi:MAG TPA: LCP family protein [Candidatus Saccharimonadales bacterium]
MNAHDQQVAGASIQELIHRPSGAVLPDLTSGGRARLQGALPGTQRTAHGHFAWLKRKRTWKRAALGVLIIVLLIGGWVGFKFLYNFIKVFHGNPFSALATTPLRGEDSGRVNILLAGNSSDDPGHQGANLTDSIMVVSIDTRNNTAFMLSIPRDLWVAIPGYDHAKINEAYVDGQQEDFNKSGYFPGGMGLLQEVVQNDFGIKLDYYALIDYGALRDAVNAVGGITVTIHSQDPRGLYDPSTDYATGGPLVRLSNGVHTLDGEQALDLARARGDAYGSYGFPSSDFDRTANQRMMLLALKSKMTSTGVLANPIKLTNLFDAVGKNVHTDFSPSEAHRLYDIGNKVPGNDISSIGLNNADGVNLLSNYTTYTGESALVPAAGMDDFSDIQAFVRRLTSTNPVVKEDAQIVVLNATNTDGLAANAAKMLKGKGTAVIATGDANALANTTTIIDLSGGKKPATKELLESLYGNNVTTTNPYGSIYQADFIVVLGADQVSTSTTSDQSSQ